MSSNKDRLYVTLHARSTKSDGKERYHWALLIAPKKEKEGLNGTQIHAKNVIRPGGIQEWICEQTHVDPTIPGTTLVRICIAKIVDTARLLEVLNAVPVQSELPNWTCISWVQGALRALQDLKTETDGILGRHVLEWERVSDAALTYVRQKSAEGRFSQSGTSKVPTWDVIEDREITP